MIEKALGGVAVHEDVVCTTFGIEGGLPGGLVRRFLVGGMNEWYYQGFDCVNKLWRDSISLDHLEVD